MDDINQLKKYLAQEGALDMTIPDNLKESKVVINLGKFLELIRTICLNINIPVTNPKI
jgi:hypothetical protein